MGIGPMWQPAAESCATWDKVPGQAAKGRSIHLGKAARGATSPCLKPPAASWRRGPGLWPGDSEERGLENEFKPRSQDSGSPGNTHTSECL